MTRITHSSKFHRVAGLKAQIVALASLTLTSCSSSLPEAGKLPDFKKAQEDMAKTFVDSAPTAVERIRVDKSSMKPRSAKPPLPPQISSMQIDVKFPGNHEATVGALVQTLTAVNLQVGFQWTNTQKGDEILQKKLPFLSFQGTVGELLSSLRTGIGIVAWYENGMVFLSDKERYSVSLPQNKDVLETVSKEITSLGATEVVSSIRGGKVLYSATPTVQDDLIGPYLTRMSRNLAVVNMQIAVVSLALNDKSAVGFDWNAFQVAFNSTAEAIGAAAGVGGGSGSSGGNGGTGGTGAGSGSGTGSGTGTGNGSGTGNGTGTGTGNGSGNSGTPSITVPKTVGSIVNIGTGGVAFSKTSLGTVVGTYGAMSVAGAISFLSNFGNTNVTQNVSLRTLSGSEVALRSGQEVPYVSGVSSTTNGNSSGSTGSTQTEKVQTGLTIKTTPHYDADAELVTLDVNVELKQILSYVELKAGNEIGTITQPLTQDQSLSDIVRVQAGRTVVIGGLQNDSESRNGVEPAFLKDSLAKSGKSFGQRSQDIQRNALFIILRPSVTIYETGE